VILGNTFIKVDAIAYATMIDAKHGESEVCMLTAHLVNGKEECFTGEKARELWRVLQELP